jgi:integrase/recombinase XerC
MGRTLGLVSWKLEIKNERTTAYRDTKGPGTTAFQEMIAVTDARKDTKGIRDKAILRLLFDLGLRRGEVVSLDIDDVDLEKRTIWIMGKGKTQKQALTLPQRTMDVLQAWLERRGSDPGPLFTNMDRARKGDGRISGTSIYRLVRDLGEKIGVKTRPHGIRHSAITVALKKAQAHQIDLEEVLDFSRHADVKTMMLYRDRERNVQGKLSELVSDSV